METPPVIIYAESTPNPSTLKFVINRAILPDYSVTYTDASQTSECPLAANLFSFNYVKAIYIANNFITVTKQPTVEWVEIMNELREFIKTWFTEEKPVFTNLPAKPDVNEAAVSGESLSTDAAEQKIIEILDEYIKPAVEQDGGEITFKSFENGIVSVELKGSCSGCPSSTLTLKAGIEQLLKRMVPGVESVVAENA